MEIGSPCQTQPGSILNTKKQGWLASALLKFRLCSEGSRRTDFSCHLTWRVLAWTIFLQGPFRVVSRLPWGRYQLCFRHGQGSVLRPLASSGEHRIENIAGILLKASKDPKMRGTVDPSNIASAITSNQTLVSGST